VPPPPDRPKADQEIQPLWLVEKQAIESAIERCDGNVPKAAALLEISPSTIYRKRQAWEAAPS
jgi:two-component system repressor protein LuxO